jgi:tRNA pseudouridine55 synthase
MYTLESLRALADEQGFDALDSVLLPIDAALPNVAALTLSDTQVLRIRQGQRFAVEVTDDCDLLRLYDDDGLFIGLGSVVQGNLSVRRLLAY